jgi:hypothetical protein
MEFDKDANKYNFEFVSAVEKWEEKNNEQLDRLAKLLRQDVFQKVRSLPYPERYTLERMTEVEDSRIKEWRTALSSEQPDILDLIKILNAKTPDIEGLAKACAKFGLEDKMDIFLEVYSEGKKSGMTAVASKRGETNSKKSLVNHEKIGMRWLDLELRDPKRYSIKEKVAVQLGIEFKLEPGTIKKIIAPRNYPALFPEGFEEARRAAGLPPRPPKPPKEK